MNIKHLLIALIAVGLTTPLGAVATRAPQPEDLPAGSKAILARDSATAQLLYRYFFIEGVRQQNLGHYAAAFDLMTHAQRICPKAAEVYYNLSRLYYLMDKPDTARALVARAVELAPDNYTYRTQQARSLIAAKEVDLAVDDYEKLYSQFHRRDDLNILLQLYSYKNDYPNIIRTLDRIETKDGDSEQLSLSKMHVYEQLGEKKKEEQVLTQLVDKHPNDLGYQVMMGNWMLQNGKKKQALRVYQKVLAQEPTNTAAQLSMLDYYRADGDTARADRQAMSLLENPKVDDDTKLALMRQAIQKKGVSGDSTEMMLMFGHVLESNPKSSKLLMLYASYMSLRKLPTDSIDRVLERVLAIDPDNSSARIQLIQDIWPSEQYDRAIRLSQEGQQYNPDDMAFYYFEGIAAYQKGDKDMALGSLRRGVSQIKSDSNPDLVSDFYAIMGDILSSKDRISEAYAAYDSCLQWKADNIGCLNNYAYYLSINNGDLQKAEQMSRKTIEAEPTNGTYLDTYAWILFLEKRYDEALTFIDRAIADTSATGVVYDHAGDIHAVSGDIDGAVKLWQKAIDTGENTPLIEEKIRKRKYLKEE